MPVRTESFRRGVGADKVRVSTVSPVGIYHHTGGGNPAGVWVGDALPDAATMQGIAGDVGYSKTAFVALRQDSGALAVGIYHFIRRNSPLAACG